MKQITQHHWQNKDNTKHTTMETPSNSELHLEPKLNLFSTADTVCIDNVMQLCLIKYPSVWNHLQIHNGEPKMLDPVGPKGFYWWRLKATLPIFRNGLEKQDRLLNYKKCLINWCDISKEKLFRQAVLPHRLAIAALLAPVLNQHVFFHSIRFIFNV